MKVLLAYDGSACSDVAVEDLPRAGFPASTDVHILSLADVFLPPATTAAAAPQVPAAIRRAWEQAAQAVEQAQSMAGHARTRLHTLCPTWQVQELAEADSPAWGIIKYAETWDADVIVVGSHGRSTLGRMFLGSVSARVLTEARNSVRIARERRRQPDAPIRVLLGVDGSPDAEVAVQTVAARSWPAGSEARVVVAVDAQLQTILALSEVGARWHADETTDAQTLGSRIVQAAIEQLRPTGLQVTSTVQDGDPKHVLLAEAEQWEADCIFLGARGLKRIERFVLGSVSTAVATRASCSVEVVRPARGT
jgi:nucleotide-binding universal stress UspA family protein